MAHTFRRRSVLIGERLEARRLLAIDSGLVPSIDFESRRIDSNIAMVEESFGFAELKHDDEADEREFLPEALREVMSGYGKLEPDAISNRTPHVGGPNISVSNAHLRNGAGTAITSPAVGERLAVQVNFSTLDLPAGASYRILYSVDGVTLESAVVTSGANGVNGNFFWFRSGWFATPGSHTVNVFVDGYDTVAENNEADNSFSFSFTSVAAVFPQKLRWPIEGQPFSDVNFTNYVDLDPLPTIRDYNNGPASYDGHDAWDIGPWNFHKQDEGIELYAAADGIVSGIYDGAFDRQTSWISPAPPANYVVIDHGSGWTTVYWHMRRDTVRVKVGDAVTAGDTLGQMGSSGISSGTHIHFGLRHFGLAVEPMLDQATYMENPLPYVQDTVGLIDFGVTNYNPSSHNGERPSDVDTFRQAAVGTVYVWGAFAGLDAGNLLEYVWRRPNGTVYLTTSSTIGQNYRGSWWWWSRNLPANPDLGTWTVDFQVNSVVLGSARFDVTIAGASEIRVEDSAAAIILDGRATPLPFATAASGSIPIPITLQVRNHGQTPLNVLDVQVPEGFVLTDSLPSSIAAGSSDALTFTMDTTLDGYRGGRVRIFTNDADESEYDFAIEGYVQGVVTEMLTLGIGNPNLKEGERTIANVRRSGNTSQSLVVNINQPITNQLTLPSSVVIPAGIAWTSFFIEGVMDLVFEQTQLLSLTAQAVGMNPAKTELKLDNTVAIVDRRTFYNRSTSSTFGDGSGNPINAIDQTKQALLPGETTASANYTNYSRGLNGLVVDVAGPLNLTGISAASFQFATWSAFPDSTSNFVTINPTITVSTFAGGGLNGSDRVKLDFPNNAIQNAWLRVTILADANTGLTANDVFYFGNARFDVTPTSPFPTQQVTINAFDVNAIRARQGQNSGIISNIHDVDRSGVVNAFDINAVRAGQGVSSLRSFTAPSSSQLGLALTSSRVTMPNVDSVLVDTSWLEAFQIDDQKRGRAKRR